MVINIKQSLCSDQHFQIETFDSWFSFLNIVTRCVENPAIPINPPCWGYNPQIGAETLSEEHLLLLTRCLIVDMATNVTNVKTHIQTTAATVGEILSEKLGFSDGHWSLGGALESFPKEYNFQSHVHRSVDTIY